MPKRGLVIASAIAAVLVVGGGTATAIALAGQASDTAPEAGAASEPVETSAPGETPEPSEPGIDVEALTAPGAVCHPNAGDDFPCLVVAPDLAVLNMTGTGRAGEPLISMADADRIALAHEACSVLAEGGSAETVTLIETNDPDRPATANNFAVFSAGAAAYCPEYAEQWVQDELSAATQSG